MQMGKLTLFIEINESSFIFTVGEYNNDYNFQILEKINSENKVFSQNKLIDVEEAKKLMQNYIKEAKVILEKYGSKARPLITLCESLPNRRS